MEEAAQVLKRSGKRVRQMLAEGKLVAIPGETPTRIPAAAVIELAKSLGSRGPKPGPKPAAESDVIAALAELTALVNELRREQKAITEQAATNWRTEKELRDALAAERAERERLELEVRQLSERPSRNFFGFATRRSKD